LQPITITLSGAPVGKGRPRFVRKTGHAFTPASTRRYEDVLRYAAQVEMNGRAPIEGPVRVEVTALFPIPASWSKKKRSAAEAGFVYATVKPDSDNLLKVLDSLNEVVWRDDKQITDARIVKGYSTAPRYVVTVTPLENFPLLPA
jgi:Holliday junction resolvase RusA-like endonuclease